MNRASRLTGFVRVLALIIAVGGCTPADPGPLRPVQRFVDEIARETGSYATGVIESDRRYVLDTHVRFGRMRPQQARVDAEGTARVTLELDPRFDEVDRVFVTGSYGAYGADQGHEPLAPQLVAVRKRDGRPECSVELPFDAEDGRMITTILHATAAPRGPGTQVEVPASAMPAGARLRFAIGVDAGARDSGPVRFSVRICVGQSCEGVFEETLDPSAQPGWHERDVDLGVWQGQMAALHFETHFDVERSSLPYWANPTIFAPDQRDTSRRSVVLISFDTLGALHLPTYGYARDTAPFLDRRVARQGTVFEEAVAPAATTPPSHMSAFTGLQPSAHGVLGNVDLDAPLEVPILAQLLRDSGYTTGAVTEDGPLAASRGFARGFDSYAENKSVARGASGFARKTFRDGIDWIAKHRDERFFLFLHTFQVHTPYSPPEAYSGLFLDPLPGEETLPEAFRPTLYDREIRYLDDQFQIFFEELEAQGLWDDTLLVVMADHGEAFNEHGLLFHGGNLYQEVLHVPLIFFGPEVPAGRRVGASVSLTDLMPTLVEWMGVPVPDGLMGKSLVGLVRGSEDPADWRDRPVFSESWTPYISVPTETAFMRLSLEPPALSVRRNSEKLLRAIYTHARLGHLFDLEADPGELNNLSRLDRSRAEELGGLLDDYLAHVQLVHERLAGRTAPLAYEPLDPEQEEKLRALGYLD